MIDEKKIREAAVDFDFETKWNNDADCECLAKKSFEEGAMWAQEQFLKDLWHKPSEKPKNESDIIVLTSFDNEFYSVFYYVGNFMVRDVHHDDDNFIEPKDAVKWCYISDILHKRKIEP